MLELGCRGQGQDHRILTFESIKHFILGVCIADFDDIVGGWECRLGTLTRDNCHIEGGVFLQSFEKVRAKMLGSLSLV